MVVTVGGMASNGVTFTVNANAPSITSLNPTSGTVGTSVTITGTNFGASQGSSTVTFNGTPAPMPAPAWSATSIVVAVPSASDHRECGGNRRRSGKQWGGVHGEFRPEHYESESESGAGGKFGDNHRNELWR